MPPNSQQPTSQPVQMPAGQQMPPQPGGVFSAQQVAPQLPQNPVNPVPQPQQVAQQPMQVPAGQQMPPQPPAPQTIQEKPKQVKQNTTQRSLLFSELRDNMIVMADGSFRAVVACQSINFDLMSNREREGIELSYQSFLNALYFPVQILIRSQRVDIGPYIDKLDAIRKSQDNMLLNVLMDDYINFIAALSEEANIMDKSFYVVVPYFPAGDTKELVKKSTGFFSKIFSQKTNTVTRIDKNTYEKAKEEVKNRVDTIMSGLFQVGIQCTALNTKQLGELYYNSYNPDTAVREPIGDFENTTSTYVTKGTGEAPRPHLQEGGM